MSGSGNVDMSYLGDR